MLGEFWKEFVRCFKGAYRWAAWVAMVEGVAFTVVLVYMVIGLLDATTTRNQILYAVGTLGLAMCVVLIKVWFWLLLHRQALEDRIEALGSKGDA
jgi:fumarate reductase subunit D